MADYKNPTLGTSAIRTSETAGQMTLNPFLFDFAQVAYRPAALNIADRIQIGVVPAGEKLVPHLCLIDLSRMDSGATGTYSIGTTAVPAALKGSTAGNAVATYSGEDFTLATAEVGSRYVDTPIYVVMLVASTTVPVTGVINAKLVSRPWDLSLDGDS